MGFDRWSFVFQTVNFLVLVWALTKLVYRPLKKSIAERDRAIAEREQAARASADAAEAKLTEAKAEAGRVEAEREALLRVTREQAATLRGKLVAQAEEEAAAARKRAEHLVEVERRAGLERVRELAVDKSAELAGALLAGLPAEAIDGALFTMLLDEMRGKLGASGLGIRGADRAPRRVEVTFARAPQEGAPRRIEAALSEVLGAPIELAIAHDPSLVAGAVLRVGHDVWDASVGGRLTAFRERARRALAQTESHD